MLMSLFTDPKSDESWEFAGGLVVRSPDFSAMAQVQTRV